MAKRIIGFLATTLVLTLLASLLPSAAREGVEVGHWTSVLPPLLAVLVALFFRKLLVALGSALLLGAILSQGPNPLTFVPHLLDAYLWQNVASEGNLYILAFTFALVGMVNVMNRSGGSHGLVNLVVSVAKSARSTRLSGALLGLVIFFDDYANAIVVGGTMRKLTDRWRIPREKLAYIVDSTAAPVAGLAIISTWIAFEVGLFGELSESLGLGRSGYEFFLAALPMRFYCLAALVIVFVNQATERDFGPMLTAERRAFHEGKVLRDGAVPLTSRIMDSIEPPPGARMLASNAIVPLVLLVTGVVGGMLWSGRGAVADEGLSFSLLSADTWRLAFGAAESGKVLFLASMGASLVAVGMAIGTREIGARDAVVTWAKGVPSMWLAATILILAWGIKSVCDDLHTPGFLISVLGERLDPKLLPVATFGIAAATAFATGTSWGTMSILLPVVVPIAASLAGAESVILLLTAAAVLDGAIFGDHCSPISDTTVLSSMASGCDHVDHVRTQAPYAIVGMLLAAGFGYLAVGEGLSPWIGHLAILAGSIGVFLVFGRKGSAPLPAPG